MGGADIMLLSATLHRCTCEAVCPRFTRHTDRSSLSNLIGLAICHVNRKHTTHSI